jgi:hypothetical protein
MKRSVILVLISQFISSSLYAQNLGNYSANPYAPNSTSNPYGAGSPYSPNSINNPYGAYGSPYSNQSSHNPYATNAPKLYDQNGNYHGRLSSNPYDPE